VRGLSVRKDYEIVNFARTTKKEIIWMSKHLCEHGHTYLAHPNCYPGQPPERIGFLDIEASNLNADFGIILSYCIGHADGIIANVIKPTELKSKQTDKRVVQDLLKDLEEFDRVVTYYGTKYDIPFIRSRALEHKLTFPDFGTLYHTDVYYWAKAKLCIHRKRLQTVCDFLGIKAKEHPLHGGMWTKALSGCSKSLDYILTHNMEDVTSLAEVFYTLSPFCPLRNASV
jgi:uncharacterized protein YprB with RNaseH-like and TPR domain